MKCVFIFCCFFGILTDHFGACKLSGRVCREKKEELGTEFCCTNYYEHKNGTCLVCDKGFTTTYGKPCEKCQFRKYGKGCIYECNCTRERCDHVNGCVENTVTKKTPQDGLGETAAHKGDSKNTTKWPIISSIVVAVLALIIALAAVFAKFATKLMKTELVLKAISKTDKGDRCQRNTNIYGSYQKKGDNFQDEDEYEFDSDHGDDFEEDQYAVIRDSQLLPEITKTAAVDDDCNRTQCDGSIQNYISSYNHLNLTGIRTPIPSGQKPSMNKYSHATYGSHMLTFKDDGDYA